MHPGAASPTYAGHTLLSLPEACYTQAAPATMSVYCIGTMDGSLPGAASVLHAYQINSEPGSSGAVNHTQHASLVLCVCHTLPHCN